MLAVQLGTCTEYSGVFWMRMGSLQPNQTGRTDTLHLIITSLVVEMCVKEHFRDRIYMHA